MNRSTAVLAAVASVVAAGHSFAQTPRYLTLEDALALARERSPALQRVVAQAEASGADVLAGVGAFFPSLNGNLNFNGSSSTVVTGTDDFGQQIELDESVTFRSSSAAQGLTANLTLFDGLQNLHNLRSARAGANAAHAAVEAEEARLDAEVKRLFYQALRFQELIALEERLLEARRGELVATERLFRVAAQTQVDVLGAQVDVSRQEQALEGARGEARKALLQLGERIGLSGEVAFEVAGAFVPVFDPTRLDADSLVSDVLRRSPMVQQYEARAVQADFSARAARGRRWPTITASASFGRSLRSEGYQALFEFNPRDRTWSFGFGMQVPLFNRFGTSQAIAQAVASQRSAEQDLRAVYLQLEREVRSAYIDLQNTHQRLELAERSAELGRQRLGMAREQYLLGSRTFTELQQIVATTANDERQALSARLEYVNAVVTLEELVGRPVRP